MNEIAFACHDISLGILPDTISGTQRTAMVRMLQNEGVHVTNMWTDEDVACSFNSLRLVEDVLKVVEVTVTETNPERNT